jgi:hypothetical protein
MAKATFKKKRKKWKKKEKRKKKLSSPSNWTLIKAQSS